MATWAPLRELLSTVEDSRTLTWEELDALVGGLPPSAHRYPAFFAGDRSAWAGFRTRNVQLGREVTFERVANAARSEAVLGAHDLEALVVQAAAATGIGDRDSLVCEALETLIRVTSAQRLADLGGTDATAAAGSRRRNVRT